MYCLVIDGGLYFVNYTILKKLGLLKSKEHKDKGIEGQIEKVIPKILNKKNVIESLKYMGVTALLINLPESIVGMLTKMNPNVQTGFSVLTGQAAYIILLKLLGLTGLDYLVKEKFSLNKSLRRAIAIAGVLFERDILRLPCECTKTCNR